jgi:hypothetical protein
LDFQISFSIGPSAILWSYDPAFFFVPDIATRVLRRHP